MIAAGAEALETDIFQASRLKLEEWGLGEHTLEINRRAAELARAAAGEDRFVAGSIGPTGHLPASDDPTLGKITFGELVEVFTEQARGLVDGGADLIIIETAQDILEVKAAVFGAREAFKLTGRTLPIQTSVSLLPNGGKMLLGTDIQAVLTTLLALDVDVIGLNCSTGPEDMRDAIRFLGEFQPGAGALHPQNAGLPLQGPEGETIFPEEPDPAREHPPGVRGALWRLDRRRLLRHHAGPHRRDRRPCRRRQGRAAAGAGRGAGVEHDDRDAAGAGAAADARRRARGLAGLAQGQGAAAGRRLRRPRASRRGPGDRRRALLDVCVALTERQDEAEQMREVVKRIALSQPAPIQVDSTEPDVIKTALEQIPGRAIVNSVNLEAGRDKLDVVAPLAKAHGAALIALTIDEVGMAKTAERKVEVAKRIVGLACDEHGLDPEALIFDALTFTLTTGDEEWRPSAVETIEGIRRIKAEIPGVKTSLGVSNVSFGVSPGARAVLNSVFLHHCVEAGLDLAMVNPNHIKPYNEIAENERELTDDLVFNKREDALERFIGHFEQKGETEEEAAGDPTEGMEPEEALHFHILRRKKEGVEEWIDRSVEKIGAVPTLNEVLLPAMKEVGDKFGAGELILPFVLQSATVMKRAVAQLENYLERIDGHTKGKVVIATVFGDVHDIGKSLVNTILTNNGYTVIDLGKQVPIDTIINAAIEHEADAIGLSALLVSTSKQMPTAVQELHERGLECPVLIGGAAINRDFGRRILYPKGKESDEIYEPGVFYCKDAFAGLATVDQLVDVDARGALLTKSRDEARKLREQVEVVDDGPPVTDSSVRSTARTDVVIPEPPFWGARELDIDLDDVFPYLDRHVLFKLHWGGRGVKGEEWERLVGEDFQPRLERMWREQDYLHPRARLGYFPAAADGNELVVFDPEDHEREIERLSFPRQPKHDRICLADFFRPLASGERDVVALQGVTVGPEVTELMAELERDGEFAEQLFTHGLGVQTAEGLAEWLHAEIRRGLGIELDQGRRYSWGYPRLPRPVRAREGLAPARPRADRHEPVRWLRRHARAVDGCDVAHHPQAVYFGMKSGFIPGEGRGRADRGYRAGRKSRTLRISARQRGETAPLNLRQVDKDQRRVRSYRGS